MHYTLESEDLLVEINSKGMEISSIRSKATGLEYLWQGDPAVWNGQAPVLFPIVGALKEGKFTYKNQEYYLPKHGFVRNSDRVKFVSQTRSELTLKMESSEETLASYPFQFEFEVKFSLLGKTLEVSHTVKNLGQDVLLYSLGAHPAFNYPLWEGEKLEDYRISFPEAETDHTWLIKEGGLIGGEGDLLLNNSKEIQLNAHLFDGDALIFKHLKSRSVSLEHRQKGPVVQVDFADFEYLGIWAKPGAPYVCIEPWLGIGDSFHHNGDLTQKEGILDLAPESSDTKSYQIHIL